MSAWTHTICAKCWRSRHPDRVPVIVGQAPEEPCCFCRELTSVGIYVRHTPAETLCDGTHKEGPA